jgi:hypothetical protein
MVEAEKIKEVEDQIRDIINWIVVFEDGYSVPKEVVDTLRSKLEEVAGKVGSL